ncbi:uncharacterized protein [Periplaneta americana]|uniref:uncharacterized protein n=1 Tax=Periplaneta americana TaxID=6978 RepID=UPI0037E8C428
METPPRKAPREKIRSQSRKLIYNVFKFCKEEKKNGLVIPLKRAVERTAKSVGKSEKSVRNIAKECEKASLSGTQIVTPDKNRKRQKKCELDEFEKCVIRRTFLEYYAERREIPTVKKLFSAVKEKINFNGGQKTFWRLLKDMGYTFKKCKNVRHVLIERHDIVARRAAYLRALRKNEKGPKKPIVYTDETWVHTHSTVKKCWQRDEIPGVLVNNCAGQRAIVVHAGGEMGFIHGAELIYDSRSATDDCHNEMNSATYNRWLREKLIPNLPAESIVVLDNAPYHTVQENRAPTMASRKEQIVAWLKENGLKYAEDLTKRELLEIVKANKLEPVYSVDRILRENGFTVLRLPPHNCDLNPMELIWNLLKQRTADKNVSSVTFKQLREVTSQCISDITEQDWKRACAKVKAIQEEYWYRDALMEEEIERIITDVGLVSSDEENAGNTSIANVWEDDDSSTDTTSGSSTETASETGTMRALSPLQYQMSASDSALLDVIKTEPEEVDPLALD